MKPTFRKKRVAREGDLYPSLRRYLVGKGYVVEGAVNGRSFTLPLSLQNVDVIGFKKRGNDVAVVGIEVKRGTERGPIRAAFAQAIAYQAVIPEVFIATPARDFAEIRPHLRELGVGFFAWGGVSSRGCGLAPTCFEGRCTAPRSVTPRSSVFSRSGPRGFGDSTSGPARPGGAATARSMAAVCRGQPA